MSRRAKEIPMEKRICADCGMWHWCAMAVTMIPELCFDCWFSRRWKR